MKLQDEPSGQPITGTFPAPIYREAVLAPIFRQARRFFLEPLLAVERAHTLMLAQQGIIPAAEAALCLRALDDLDADAIRKAEYDGSFEDLFFFVERQLAAACGAEIAGKMHTARSRNDIDLTMYRMLVRARLLTLLRSSLTLRTELVGLAERHRSALMPGYTHNQPAQPTTLGHYLMAFVEILERDAERLLEAFRRVNRSPLGACAITTTGFRIDRATTAELLGFEGLQVNSYGAIAAVDYAAESCSAVATAMLSQGRFVQDLLLWSTAEFGYLRLSDAFVQISSIMPQKRNPVALEHVRILASRALFGAQGVLASLHNTPFADMNDAEDPLQPAIYTAFADAQSSIDLLRGLLAEAEFATDHMAAAAEKNFLSVTELADTLVRQAGLSFHAAHAIVSAGVRTLNEQGLHGDMEALTDQVLASLSAVYPQAPVSRAELREALRASNFVAVRDIPGGPALTALEPELDRARHQLALDEERWAAATRRLAGAQATLLRRSQDLAATAPGTLRPARGGPGSPKQESDPPGAAASDLKTTK